MQACLDHTFKGQRASCLVNPRSGYELELNLLPVTAAQKKKIAVVRRNVIILWLPSLGRTVT
jgi:2,4-dienoyl-CoA reductase (NADPH2)